MLNSVGVSDILISKQDIGLSEIAHLDKQLFQRFKGKFVVQPSLSRLLVTHLTQPVEWD